MLHKKCESVEGIFYWDGQFQAGRYVPEENKFESLPEKDGYDLFIPLPINAHTHIGDSFIRDEPKGSLMEIVGPGGFKHSQLKNASEKTIIDAMKKSMKFMKKNYTASFFDFRETGTMGINTIRAIRENFPEAIVLARPSHVSEIDKLIQIIDGIGFSSINDHNLEYIMETTRKMKTFGGIIATHFSESEEENMEILRKVDPDLLIHCTGLKEEKLVDLGDICSNVAITPRSNHFYGIRPDYAKFLDAGLNLMLGTDNAMVVEPDLFNEMEWLYRYQKNIHYMSPQSILKCAIVNPDLFLKKMGHRRIRDKWIRIKGKRPTPFQIVTRFHSISEKSVVQFLPK